MKPRKILILMRHANAETFVNSDFERPLTLSGQQNARLAAEHLHKMNLRPSIILTSPLTRAKQTAEIIGQQMNVKVEDSEKLSGILTAQDLRTALTERFAQYDILLAVGHNPNISQTAQLLSGKFFVFSPAEFAVFDMTDSHHPKLIMPEVRP